MPTMSETKVMLTGATGFLGHYLADQLTRRGLAFVTVGRGRADVHCDLADEPELAGALEQVRPSHVLHCGAMALMAECERDPRRAAAVNTDSVAVMLGRSRARLLLVSTDLVFDGEHAPYAEDARPRPLSVYGSTKVEAEELVRASARGLVVRVPLLFGKSFDGRRGATDMIRSAFADRRRVTLFSDETRTPLHASDAADALVTALVDERQVGVLHLPGPERVTRAEFGLRFCVARGLDTTLLGMALCNDSKRPRDTSLLGSFVAPRDLAAMLADS